MIDRGIIWDFLKASIMGSLFFILILVLIWLYGKKLNKEKLERFDLDKYIDEQESKYLYGDKK